MEYKNIELKSGDILVFKAKGWKTFISNIKTKNFSFDKIFRFGIRFVTLSNYTHTASIIKEGKDFYLISALAKTGVTKEKCYMPWLLNSINSNHIDVFRQNKFNKIQFNNKYKVMKNFGYSFRGIINIFTDTFFRVSFFNVKGRVFCSQLTSELHNLKFEKKNNLVTPRDIAMSNNLKRIY